MSREDNTIKVLRYIFEDSKGIKDEHINWALDYFRDRVDYKAKVFEFLGTLNNWLSNPEHNWEELKKEFEGEQA